CSDSCLGSAVADQAAVQDGQGEQGQGQRAGGDGPGQGGCERDLGSLDGVEVAVGGGRLGSGPQEGPADKGRQYQGLGDQEAAVHGEETPPADVAGEDGLSTDTDHDQAGGHRGQQQNNGRGPQIEA